MLHILKVKKLFDGDLEQERMTWEKDPQELSFFHHL